MLDVEKLKFDDRGLIPAIVVDDETGKVLTLAAFVHPEPDDSTVVFFTDAAHYPLVGDGGD